MRRVAAAALAFAFSGCAPVIGAPAVAGPRAEIVAMMEASADGWNRRDLDAFLVPYLAGAEPTFVGGTGLIRGRDAIREMYASGWFAPGRDPGRLRFEEMEVRPLGPDHALATGRYVVEIPGRDTATGIFTIVLRRTAAGWRIVHDHSS
jgi:uncharacterized protein (TIGR02246 family)